MSYAAIMVHVGDTEASDAHVRLAASLTDRLQARLIGVGSHATWLATGAGDLAADAAMEAQALADVAHGLERRGDRFRSLAGTVPGTIEWRYGIEDPVDLVARLARAADLIISGRDPAAGELDPSRRLGELLVRAGRPLLIAPPGVDQVPGRRVLVGWKDTREARRAVREAIPLLQLAENVSVAGIVEQGDDQAVAMQIDDVCVYLQRHGAAIGARLSVSVRTTAAAGLFAIAEREGADLIVAGGYGHSRLGEWLFGGVTRELLSSSPVCCLLAH